MLFMHVVPVLFAPPMSPCFQLGDTFNIGKRRYEEYMYGMPQDGHLTVCDTGKILSTTNTM